MRKRKRNRRAAASILATAMVFGILPSNNTLHAAVRLDQLKVKDIYEAEDSFSKINGDLSGMFDKLGSIGDISGEYEETDYNRLSLLSTVGGSILSIQHYPKAGESVHIMVEPDKDYGLSEIRAIDANGNGIPMQRESGKDYTFVMPEPNVKVEAYFSYQGEKGGVDAAGDGSIDGEMGADEDENADGMNGIAGPGGNAPSDNAGQPG